MPVSWIAKCLALTLAAMLWPGAAAAQNIVGTWQLDPVRSNVRAPDGQTLTDGEVLTIGVRGTFIDVSYPLHSLSGMGLPLGGRRPRDPMGIAYSFAGQNAAPVDQGPTRGTVMRVRTEPDLSGFTVTVTGPKPNETTFRTSPDGEMLTIETIEERTHLVRVFTRQH